MFFDSHAHLDDKQFDQDRHEVIRRARDEHGVRWIVNIGYNRETIMTSLQLAEKYDFIYTAIGWHPQDAGQCSEEDLEWVDSLTVHPKVVAIGEIGLDYYWDTSPKEIQEDVFRKQIRLAISKNLPVIIHDRDAHEDIVRILHEEEVFRVGGVMHCFSGDVSMMKACVEMNLHIGLGGPVTFKNAALPKEVAREVPLGRLLVETDCPYLAPHPFRGKRNESSHVSLVAEAIAQIRGMPVEELAQTTLENAKRLFKIEENR